ncbi:MAG: tyrosine-protein phosphatase [Thermomicrobia bacterium]|nr:tyrosine-protein phosphatase [Thermomicrobia bacterium]
MPTRHLHWEACTNARDLGGHATDDGATIRWGALVRADAVGRLTERGCAALEAYGVRTIIDLRVPVEVRDEPSPFTTHATIATQALPLDPNDRAMSKAVVVHKAAGIPPMAAMNVAYLETHQAQIAAIMRAIADAPDGGIVVHCHAGRDSAQAPDARRPRRNPADAIPQSGAVGDRASETPASDSRATTTPNQ